MHLQFLTHGHLLGAVYVLVMEYLEKHVDGFVDPLTYVMVRPFIKWEMAHGILMPGYGATGFMGYQDPDVMCDMDTAQKNARWHMTCYSGPVLKKTKAVVHLRNLIPTRYIGGGGVRFYQGRDHVRNVDRDQQPCDAYAFVSRQADLRIKDRLPIDITGRFTPADVIHYQNANHVPGWLRWTRMSTSDGDKQDYNTVVYAGNAFVPSVDSGGKLIPNAHLDTGNCHWGAIMPTNNFTAAVIGRPSPMYGGLAVLNTAGDLAAPPAERRARA